MDALKGANHSQFGYYGFQLGHNEAGITREEQQQQILAHILDFIKSESKLSSKLEYQKKSPVLITLPVITDVCIKPVKPQDDG